jgi:hypothetical protein
MASTYSDLKIELIGTGEQTGTWGTTTNDNFSIAIGEAITGSADVAFSSADVTVTLTNTNASQAARNLRLNLTGTSGGARNLILGSGCQIDKLYLINNGLADAVTVKNTSGTGIAVPAGKTMFVYNNGTNVVDAITYLSSLDTGTINATTVDTTNLEVTNLKAKDGTAAGSIANSTGVVTLASSVLTTTDINGGTIDGTVIGGASAAAGNFTTLGATGVATFSAGTVSAPAITTTGDTNTGIFFPAADTIAFTEGGVESVRITSDGNVGIGASSPLAKLDVNGTIYSRTGGIFSDSFRSYSGGETTFGNGSTFTTFYTGTSERMRITSAGNVGIGTTSPANKLAIAYTSAAPSATPTNAGINFVGSSSVQTLFGSDPSSPFGAWVQTTNGVGSVFPLNLNPQGGNVGIGTSNPSQTLDVNGNSVLRGSLETTSSSANGVGITVRNSSQSDQYLSITMQGTAGSSISGWDNSAVLEAVANAVGSGTRGMVLSAFNGPIIFQTSGRTERMRIDSAGRFLVGTTATPSSANVKQVLFTSGDTYLQIASGSTGGGLLGQTGANMVFYTYTGAVGSEAYAERMRLDSNGNLGIGGAASGYGASRLAVVGGELGLSNTSDARFYLYTGSTVRGLLYADATRVQLEASGTNPLTLWTNSGERARINSNGALLVGATAQSNSERLNVTLDGNGTEVVRFVNSNGSSPYGLDLRFTGVSPNGTSNWFLQCTDVTTTRFEFRSNGGIANYSANNVNLSDAREKTNVELAGNYLDKICAIPVKTFNYIDQNRDEDDGLTLGVIAQDVQAVAPELVMESNWASKDQPEKMRLSIYQTDLQYALMKSIQELKAELDSVKAELQTLKGN